MPMGIGINLLGEVNSGPGGRGNHQWQHPDYRIYHHAIGWEVINRQQLNEVGGTQSREQKNFESALSLQQQGINLARAVGYKYGQATCLESITWTLVDKEEFQDAIKFANQGIALSKKLSHLRLDAIFHNHLAVSYHNLGEYKRAFEAQETHYELRDSLTSYQKTREINEIEVKYELEQKEIENELLKEKQMA